MEVAITDTVYGSVSTAEEAITNTTFRSVPTVKVYIAVTICISVSTVEVVIMSRYTAVFPRWRWTLLVQSAEVFPR